MAQIEEDPRHHTVWEQSEARLQALLSSIDEIVFEFDCEGNYLAVWGSNESLLARPRSELLGRRVTDILGEAEALPFLEAFRRVIETLSAESMEYPLQIGPDNRWFLSRIAPVILEDGSCMSVSMLARDITQRKRAEEALRRSEESLQLALEAADMSTWACYLDGDASVSANHSEHLGRVDGASIDTFEAFLACVHPEDREIVAHAHRAAMHDRTHLNVEFRVFADDGGVRWLASRGRYAYDPSGNPVGVSGVTLDITERKQAEDLRRQKENAEATSRAKSQFLANMSHELRTPMNAIIGFSEILADQTFGPLNDRQLKYTSNILNGGRHLLQLINDILDLSKVEAGKLNVELSRFDPGKALQEVQGIVKDLAAKKQLTITTALEPELPTVEADQAKIKQILFNLLSNAIKFTAQGGSIHVSVDTHRIGDLPVGVGDSGWIKFSVSDTGIGIKPEDHDRVFQEFEQIDSSYSREQQGTGLGLALTRRLVELHGGRIRVESEGIEGAGSTFSFVLPVRQACPDSGDALSADPAEADIRRPSEFSVARQPVVLVVEDDPVSAMLVAHHLEHGGYRVQHVTDGAATISMAGQCIPTAIILDIHLRGQNGWQVMAELKSLPETRGIPVFVVSTSPDRHLASQLGAADCFAKPVDPAALLEALSRVSPVARRVEVLVIDDDPSTLGMVTDLLEPHDFSVRTARGGQEALGSIAQRAPDAVVLDLLMADVNGLDVVEALRSRRETAKIPILVYTALDIGDDLRRHLDARVQRIAMKSANFDIVKELRSLIADIEGEARN